jgi:rubrerythrin
VASAANAAQTMANKAAAIAQGPLHAVRGTGEQEKLLKNAKTEYQDEAEEIASYTAIETLATTVGDKETAQLARRIRRDEERMASFLERLIPQLTRAVATAEIPASQRQTSRRRRSSSSRRRGASAAARSRGEASSSRSRASSSRSRGSGSRSRSRS